MGGIFSSGSNSNVQLPTQGPQGERGPPGPAGPPGNASSLIGSPMFSTAVNSQIQDSLTTLQDSIFYCDPLKDYCSLPKKGIIQGGLDIKGMLNVNDKLKINADGSVDNLMLNSLTTTNFTTTSFNQNKQSFKVGGLDTSFYPVIFTDNNWTGGPYQLEISRASVHTDSNWKGSMMFILQGHSSSWGSMSNFLNYLYKGANYGGENDMFVARAMNWGFSPSIVIWLRGGLTYNWRGTNGITLLDGNFTGEQKIHPNGPNPDSNNVRVLPILTIIDDDFDLRKLDGATTKGNRKGVYNIDSHLRTTGDVLIKGNSVWTIEEQTNDGNQLCFKQDGKTRMCLGGKNTKIWAGYDGDGKGRYMYFGNEDTTYVNPSDIGIRNKGTNTTWPSDF
jgi:hypothetical protein